MKQLSQLTLAVAVLAAAVIAGCSNPADNLPKATVTETQGTPATTPEAVAAIETNVATGETAPAPGAAVAVAPATGPKVYTFTPETNIEWIGAKVTGQHPGGFKNVTGEVNVVDNDPTKSSVTAKIDINSMWTDGDRLLGHLKSPDFFDAAQFGEATFTSTGISAMDNHYMVSGNLTLRGVTKNITFPATITIAENEVRANAEFALKRFDFDIKYAGKSDDLIRDDVAVRLNIVATPAAM